MEEENRRRSDLELDRGREAGHVLAVGGGEVRGPPLADLDQLLADLVLRRRHVTEERRVPVPHDHRALELADALERLRGLRADGDVAEADELVDALALELLQHRVQRQAVSVDVRDQPEAHVGVILAELAAGGERDRPGAAAA